MKQKQGKNEKEQNREEGKSNENHYRHSHGGDVSCMGESKGDEASCERVRENK